MLGAEKTIFKHLKIELEKTVCIMRPEADCQYAQHALPMAITQSPDTLLILPVVLSMYIGIHSSSTRDLLLR